MQKLHQNQQSYEHLVYLHLKQQCTFFILRELIENLYNNTKNSYYEYLIPLSFCYIPVFFRFDLTWFFTWAVTSVAAILLCWSSCAVFAPILRWLYNSPFGSNFALPTGHRAGGPFSPPSPLTVDWKRGAISATNQLHNGVL